MKKLIGLIFFLIATANVQARIGKTVAECDELYGKAPIKNQRTQNGWLIKNYATELIAVSCRFYNNYCFEIGTNRFDKDGKIVSLTPEQVVSFIKTNLGTIPKVDSQGKNVGANTVEHALGSDGRYVWREEETATGIITIVRDNTLAPAVRMKNDEETTNKQPLDRDEIYRVTKSDARALENSLKSGLEKIENLLRSSSVERFDVWRKAAEMGLPEGQFLYGICHNFGLCTPIDKTKASEWLTKAAEQDHTRALFTLGCMLIVAESNESTVEKGFRLLGKAAKNGLADAQYVLAMFNGDIKENESVFFQLMQQAASQGHAEAQLELAFCYYIGKGCNKDPEKVLYWTQQASNQSYSKAQYLLALAYSEGKGVTVNFSKAAQLLRAAADGGYADAQFELGRSYYIGQGVEQSYASAIIWFRAAATQEHPKAQFLLGVCFYKGQGTSTDYDEAARLYRKAAEHGYNPAQTCVANCYKNGLGVVKDIKVAYQWLLVSSKANSEIKPETLADLKKELTEKQVEEAILWANNWKPKK